LEAGFSGERFGSRRTLPAGQYIIGVHRTADNRIERANKTVPKQIGDGGERADLRVAEPAFNDHAPQPGTDAPK